MGKKRRRRRGGHRTGPKRGQRPNVSRVDDGAEPDLLGEVRRRLREPHPFAMLAEASSLYSALDPRNRNPFEKEPEPGPTIEEIVQSFLELDRKETSALLFVIAELTDDELTRARIRRELTERSHALPEWITDLGTVAPYRAVEMTHILGDGDSVLAGVRLPGGAELTFVVYIDHNLGTVVKDALVVPEPIADLVSLMQEETGDDPDVSWNDLDVADARVRITDAVGQGAITFPPYETDTWPACRPLLEWIMRLLPEGGRGYEHPEWDEGDLKELSSRFLESSFATDIRGDEENIELLDSLLWFGSGYGPGDPLHWSPVAVEILLMDWIPRKIVAPARFLGKAPEVLRAFIRFSHHERGIRAALTKETIDAVDTWEPDYLEAVGSPRPQGPAALLAAMGVPIDDPGAPWGQSVAGDRAGGGRKRGRSQAVPEVPPHVAEAMEGSVALKRFELLGDFYGDGRKLTKTGNPTLADARSLIGLLGTGDVMDPEIGDRTFKTGTAAELPELMFTIRWALAAGAVRKEHGKLRATASWRKLTGKPARRWVKAADASAGLGPLETFYAHAYYRGHDILDEISGGILSWLLEGPLPFDVVLDRVADYADEKYEWLTPYMQEPEHRRESFAHDLETLLMILGWGGIAERVGAISQPHRWDPSEERLVGGTIELTDAGRWWLELD